MSVLLLHETVQAGLPGFCLYHLTGFVGPYMPVHDAAAPLSSSWLLLCLQVTPEDCNDDLAGATEAQLKTLADWESKFDQKYGVAGLVIPA